MTHHQQAARTIHSRKSIASRKMPPMLKETIRQTADCVKNTPGQAPRNDKTMSLAAHLDGTDVHTVHDDPASQFCNRA
jgi:hypothetical protein